MKVALFATCVGDEMYPDVALSASRVLSRLGCEVMAPRVPLCCGQPAYSSGYFEEAMRAATSWLDAFASADCVVSPSGSCVGMIHHNFARLFAEDPARLAQMKKLLARTYEFSQFLVEVLEVKKVEGSFPHSVTYHPSCHATRLLGVGDAPVALLRAVPDLDLVPLPRAEDCCGFGGTFSVKLSGISTAIVDEKIDHVEKTRAHFVTSTDLGCLMNIAGRMERRGLSVKTLHLASLLERALFRGETRS